MIEQQNTKITQLTGGLKLLQSDKETDKYRNFCIVILNMYIVIILKS